jgi:hypothetical protein
MIAAPHNIELRLADGGLLFDPFDPPPSPKARLSSAASDRLLALAKLAPPTAPLRLVLDAPGADAETLRRAFALGAEDERKARAELFRTGRRALAIGLASLAFFLTLAVHGREIVPGLAMPKIVEEGLKIAAWVSLWKPAEIFLYDWLPFRRRQALYERLARGEITVAAGP